MGAAEQSPHGIVVVVVDHAHEGDRIGAAWQGVEQPTGLASRLWWAATVLREIHQGRDRTAIEVLHRYVASQDVVATLSDLAPEAAPPGSDGGKVKIDKHAVTTGTAEIAKTVHAGTDASRPRADRSPNDSYVMLDSVRPCVVSPTNTPPGGASVCRRDAVLTTSPIAV